MSFLHRLRQKPQRVRERIVFLVVILISPLLFVLWSVTSKYGKPVSSTGVADTVKTTISGTFNNPTYQDTFGAHEIQNK